MVRTLVLAAALGAMALPAAAETAVKVNIAGLDAKTARGMIVEAATKACRTELRDGSPYQHYYYMPICVRAAVDRASAPQATVEAPETAKAAGGAKTGAVGG